MRETRKTPIKWNLEKVKNYVEIESGSGCKLLSTTFEKMHSKLAFECRCGESFIRTFNSFKRATQRCRKCAAKSSSEKQSLTYREVKEFIEIKSKSGCKLISKEYINNSTPLDLKCSCSNVYSVTLASFKNAKQHKCKKCTGLSEYDLKYVREICTSKQLKLLSKKYTNIKTKMEILCHCDSIFLTSLDSIIKNSYSCGGCVEKERALNEEILVDFLQSSYAGEYILTGKYKTRHSNIKVKHTTCDNEYEITPHLLFKGIKCGKCNVGYRNSEEFINYLYKKTKGEYSLIGEYINSSEKTLFFHNKCNKSFETSPNGFQQGTRCYCERMYITKDVNQKPIKIRTPRLNEKLIKERMLKHVGDEYTLVGGFIGVNRKTTIKHNICGHEYATKLSNFFSGRRCPKCKTSRGEKVIFSILTSSNIHFQEQHKYDGCRYKRKLPFDYCIKDSLLLEYDGEDHFYLIDRAGKGEEWMIKNYAYRTKNDKIKNQYCIDNNIPLLRIPYWEQNNIEPILNTALMHFDIIPEDDSYNYTLIKEWLVDSNWDHDAYIAKCPKNKKEAAKVLTNSN